MPCSVCVCILYICLSLLGGHRTASSCLLTCPHMVQLPVTLSWLRMMLFQMCYSWDSNSQIRHYTVYIMSGPILKGHHQSWTKKYHWHTKASLAVYPRQLLTFSSWIVWRTVHFIIQNCKKSQTCWMDLRCCSVWYWEVAVLRSLRVPDALAMADVAPATKSYLLHEQLYLSF